MLIQNATEQNSTETKGNFSKEEWQIRQELAAAYRLTSHFGWDDVIFTHISARIPGPEHHFLINPLGLMFDEITASSLVKIDLNGNKVDKSPYPINAAGFTIHSAIHANRADAQCIMHLHTVAGTAISCQKDGLLPIHQTAMLLNGQVAYHDYEGVAFNPDEKPRLIKDLGAKAVLILRNHGTLAVGSSIAAAFATMYILERSCQMQIAAMSGGAPLITPSPDIQALVEKQAAQESGQVVQLLWSTLVRMLDKKDKSYRE